MYPVCDFDIAVYNAEVVPVGKDQLPHLVYREIIRRFNSYCDNIERTGSLLSEVPFVA